jgi:hypothetical protein
MLGAASIARGTRRLLLWHQVRYGTAAVITVAAMIAAATAISPDGNPLTLVGLNRPQDPIEAINAFSDAFRAGNAARMLELTYTADPVQRRRAEATVRLNLAVARFKTAAERAFGADALVKAGFNYGGGGDLAGMESQTTYFHVPHEAPLRIEPGGRVWVPVPMSNVPMVHTAGRWQVDEPTLFAIVMKMLQANHVTPFTSDVNVMARSTDHLARLFESTTKRIDSRSITSAGDAVAALDNATQGLTHDVPPRVVAMLVDVSPDEHQPASDTKSAGGSGAGAAPAANSPPNHTAAAGGAG